MLSLWANWLVTKFGLNSLKRYLWPVLYIWVESDSYEHLGAYILRGIQNLALWLWVKNMY